MILEILLVITLICAGIAFIWWGRGVMNNQNEFEERIRKLEKKVI